jgi:hypothetical protein
MKRLIYILLFIPTLCWGQGINVIYMPARPVFAVEEEAEDSLGSELMTETDFSNDTWWQDATITSEGVLTFVTSGAGGNRGTTINVVDGTKYRMITIGSSDIGWSLRNRNGTTTYIAHATGTSFNDTVWVNATQDGLYFRLNAAGEITYTTISIMESY